MKINTNETAVPNWFDKSDTESIIGRRLSRKEWQRILACCSDAMCDEVSQLFADFIKELLSPPEPD